MHVKWQVNACWNKINKQSVYNNKEYGIFIAYGDDIKKNLRYDEINYLNIAPSLLKACNQKPLDHMKGKVLNIFNK